MCKSSVSQDSLIYGRQLFLQLVNACLFRKLLDLANHTDKVMTASVSHYDKHLETTIAFPVLIVNQQIPI